MSPTVRLRTVGWRRDAVGAEYFQHVSEKLRLISNVNKAAMNTNVDGNITVKRFSYVRRLRVPGAET